MNQPLVSVVMPVYNAGKYLRPAIESILHQTYQNFELIIIDDKSTDGSLEIIKSYKKMYPEKIRVIKIMKNLNHGGDMCANEGIKVAHGKYIARMDADDISHKTRLEKQVNFLEENKSVFLVGSNANVIDKTGKIIGEKLEPTSPTEIYRSYFNFHPLIHPTCMLRAKINGKKFSYKLSYNANNDYLTFFTLLCQGAVFVNLADKLLYYRIHGKNDTFINMKQKFLNTLRIRIKMVAQYGYRPSFHSILVTILQSIIVVVLPEKVLFTMYMVSKGILKQSILTLSIPRLQLNLSFSK